MVISKETSHALYIVPTNFVRSFIYDCIKTAWESYNYLTGLFIYNLKVTSYIWIIYNKHITNWLVSNEKSIVFIHKDIIQMLLTG